MGLWVQKQARQVWVTGGRIQWWTGNQVDGGWRRGLKWIISKGSLWKSKTLWLWLWAEVKARLVVTQHTSGSDPILAGFFSFLVYQSRRCWYDFLHLLRARTGGECHPFKKSRGAVTFIYHHPQLSQVLGWRRCSSARLSLIICLVFIRIPALKDEYGAVKMSRKVWRCKNMWVLIVSSRHIVNVMMTRTTRKATFKERDDAWV